jgi:hypothetical protein
MSLTVEIKSKPSSPTVWLEITYSGLEPPVSLFDDLAMVGWTPPAIPPPPASAIDWGRPDPTTGQQFTIADYLVEGAVVEAPRGSGPLGRWTDADRRAHFAVLEGVLKRHDLLDQVKEGARPRRASPPASMPAPPAAPNATAAPMAGPQYAAVARPESESASPPTALPVGSARLVAAVAPASEAAMATSLANAGVRALSFTPVHRTVVHRYRGAESEQHVLDHAARARFGPDAVVMMLVPRAIDAGLFGGIARVLADRGHPHAEFSEIRGRYERSGGGVRLRLDAGIRADGSRVALDSVFDLDALARADRA